MGSMELVAKGWRANIFCTTDTTGQRIATKVARIPDARDAIRKEATLLQRLQELGSSFTPQLVAIGDAEFSYVWIEGEARKVQFPLLNPTQQGISTQQLLDHAYQLDQRGIIHGELDRPTDNMLIDSANQVWLIDFERGWRGDSSGKNMRHLAQWLYRSDIILLDMLRPLADMSLENVYITLSQKITQFYSNPQAQTDA